MFNQWLVFEWMWGQTSMVCPMPTIVKVGDSWTWCSQNLGSGKGKNNLRKHGPVKAVRYFYYLQNTSKIMETEIYSYHEHNELHFSVRFWFELTRKLLLSSPFILWQSYVKFDVSSFSSLMIILPNPFNFKLSSSWSFIAFNLT